MDTSKPVLMIRPRQAGKTTDILKWWTEKPKERIVVTFREDRARDLRALAVKMYTETLLAAGGACFESSEALEELATSNIISWHHLYDRSFSTRYGGDVMIDDVDMVLLQMVPSPFRLAGVSISTGRHGLFRLECDQE